ncbi:phosphate ABC superfamily ATP binding cassette transporter, binding protein [Carnobacterium divergens DSM 20623]|uniref:Phosphate-binding protein n=2 Tax=Carnobacterium divergens TaxID=2748 RepID=A0A0R2HXM3_CARDV|nr:phosphate ABC superfamily ATP binding cassette transporter, binding protein [Carnobacterium divergens DSM 20623]SUX16675.1 Phosphate-binding protein pstS precursor [Carnobacterium divergens]
MMKVNNLAKVVFTVGLGLTLVACGGNKTDSSASSQSSEKNSAPTETITAVGSTALQPLVEAAAEEYSTANPGNTITVQGGGSGTGLSQVSNGSVTIGNSDVFAEEKEGVDAKALVDHKVAVVGMGPVVNKNVGVKSISKQQLIDIFTGKITNWNEVGGKDQSIVVLNRASGSGTRASFEKWALDGQKAIQAQEQDSSGAVRKIVSETPGAISYLAFSYFDDSLLALSVDNVEPTEKNVADNSWTIWSYEHMYTKGKPSEDVQAFLDYMLTDEVQKGVVKKLGYLPISSMKVERSHDGVIK